MDFNSVINMNVAVVKFLLRDVYLTFTVVSTLGLGYAFRFLVKKKKGRPCERERERSSV